MYTIELKATKAVLTAYMQPEVLTSGMANTVLCRFSVSDDWHGLSKTAVFSNGETTISILESAWENGRCYVPHEVLSVSGQTVRVGLYGTDGAALVIPTVWCEIGIVESGAAPTQDAGTAPTLPVYAVLDSRISRLEADNPETGGAVSSVNGKTGDVVLTGADIGFTDAGGYYTADTAEGALAEIGAQLDGLAAALEGLL